MELVRLVYVSRVGREMGLAHAESIARDAAARNARLAITGFLLYTPEHFMQALEGEKLVVDGTFARIARDPRHSHIHKLSHGPIETRWFAEWSMGFAHQTRLRVPTPSNDPWHPEQVLALLREVAA